MLLDDDLKSCTLMPIEDFALYLLENKFNLNEGHAYFAHIVNDKVEILEEYKGLRFYIPPDITHIVWIFK